jgi:hypothetical protein
MAAGQGFLTSAPDAVYGDTAMGQAANFATAQKFIMPSAGTLELIEIGAYLSTFTAPSSCLIAVFTHDAVNDCPESLVANSAGTLTLSGSAVKQAHTYSGTNPQVTGGDTYWIALLSDEGFVISAFATAGELERAATAPTWPTAAEWETHSHFAYDLSLYAVYTAVGGASAIPIILGHHRQRRS